MDVLPEDVLLCMSAFTDLRSAAAVCRRLRRCIQPSWLPLRVRVSPVRMQVGVLQWLRYHHSAETRSLSVEYAVPPEYGYYVPAFLAVLSKMPSLTKLHMGIDDAFLPIPELGQVLGNLCSLDTLSLNLSMRTDTSHPATLVPIWRVATQCRRVRVALRMSDLTDKVMHTLLQVCVERTPRWEALHLNLKHNLLSDAGAAHIASVVLCSPRLARLHLNLSYNLLSSTGRALSSHFPSLEQLVLKVDSDMVEMEDFLLDSQGELDSLRSVALSAAYTMVSAPTDLSLGRSIRRMSLDLEGCRLLHALVLSRLATAIGGLHGTLEYLSLGLSDMKLTDRLVSELFACGIAPLLRLIDLRVHLASNYMTDGAVTSLVSSLPVSVRWLLLDVGDNGGVQRLHLAALTRLHSLKLIASRLCLCALDMPTQVEVLSLDLLDARVTCSVHIPSSVRSLDLRLFACIFSIPPILSRLSGQMSDISIDMAHVAPETGAALLRGLIVAGASIGCSLQKLSVAAVGVTLRGACGPLVAQLFKAFPGVRHAHLDAAFEDHSDLHDTLSAMTFLSNLETLRLQLRTNSGTCVSLPANFPHGVPRLWLDISCLPLVTGGISTLASAMLKRAGSRHNTTLTVSAGDVDETSLCHLSTVAGVPHCRVHIKPSGRAPLVARALYLDGAFF